MKVFSTWDMWLSKFLRGEVPERQTDFTQFIQEKPDLSIFRTTCQSLRDTIDHGREKSSKLWS